MRPSGRCAACRCRRLDLNSRVYSLSSFNTVQRLLHQVIEEAGSGNRAGKMGGHSGRLWRRGCRAAAAAGWGGVGSGHLIHPAVFFCLLAFTLQQGKTRQRSGEMGRWQLEGHGQGFMVRRGVLLR